MKTRQSLTKNLLAALSASLRALWCALFSAFISQAVQAGGQFDVDDAYTLEPGQCQYEVWAIHSAARNNNSLHFGPACRIGPVEVDLNLDHTPGYPGQEHVTQWGPQLKWTFLGNSETELSAALSASMAADTTHHGRLARQLVLPVSWMASSNVTVHANVGADWELASGRRTPRYGLGSEFAFSETAVLIAEASRASDALTRRAGVRLNITPLVSIDLVGARTTRQGNSFGVGFNHEFSR